MDRRDGERSAALGRDAATNRGTVAASRESAAIWRTPGPWIDAMGREVRHSDEMPLQTVGV